MVCVCVCMSVDVGVVLFMFDVFWSYDNVSSLQSQPVPHIQVTGTGSEGRPCLCCWHQWSWRSANVESSALPAPLPHVATAFVMFVTSDGCQMCYMITIYHNDRWMGKCVSPWIEGVTWSHNWKDSYDSVISAWEHVESLIAQLWQDESLGAGD